MIAYRIKLSQWMIAPSVPKPGVMMESCTAELAPSASAGMDRVRETASAAKAAFRLQSMCLMAFSPSVWVSRRNGSGLSALGPHKPWPGA